MPFSERTDWRDTPSAPPPPGSTPVYAADILRWERGLAEAHEQLSGKLSKADADATYAPVLAPGWKQRWFGGAIRNSGAAGGYWKTIDDGAHWPFGVPNVITTTTGIEIYYDFQAAGIGTVIVSPDETMSAAGWSAGASVEGDKCTIRLGRNKTIADHVTWDGTKWTSASGVFTPSWSTSAGGQLILTHERMFGHGYSVIVRGREVEAVMSTSGASNPGIETRFQLYNRSTGVQIAATADIPVNTRLYVSRMDAIAGSGAINPQAAPDQIELPNSNIWLLGVHHVAPRPT